MIQQVTVTNHLGESLSMDLRFPEKSGFLIRAIEGLGPSKANINMSEIATGDGSLYNSARITSRNIIFMLKFLEIPNIETVRQKTYKYFPLKRRIKISVESDNRISETYGYVESNEPNIFSSQEGCNISVVCPDGYFYAPDKEINSFSSVEALFEFPFSNESLVSKLLEFGEMEVNPVKTIVYNGDGTVGVTIYIHSTGTVQDIQIQNMATLEKFIISDIRLNALLGTSVLAGDDITISTVKGDKYVYLERDGDVYNILNALDKDSAWFQLEKGENIFIYSALSGVSNLQFRFENRIAYEGV